MGNDLGLNVKIEHIENPRKEAEDHYYNPKHTGLLDLGLEPNLLTDKGVTQMLEFVLRHKNMIKPQQIFRRVNWE